MKGGLMVVMLAGAVAAEDGKGLLMRELMGLNVHTVELKPELVAPVLRVLRSYDPPRWGVGEDLRVPLEVKREGRTEEEQAMWDVRSFLLLARMGADGAHSVCSFEGEDEPRRDASSGITRKPTLHALGWLLGALGEYRFSRVEREDAGECYAYEFTHARDARRRVWAVWRAHGEGRKVRLFHDPMVVERAERMPLTADAPEKVTVRLEIEGYFSMEATERPVLVWLRAR